MSAVTAAVGVFPACTSAIKSLTEVIATGNRKVRASRTKDRSRTILYGRSKSLHGWSKISLRVPLTGGCLRRGTSWAGTVMVMGLPVMASCTVIDVGGMVNDVGDGIDGQFILWLITMKLL